MIGIRDVVLVALVCLLIGAGVGGWYANHQAVKACDAARWQAEAETLRATLTVRDAVAVVDRKIATTTAETAAADEAEYAKLRSDYEAFKKSKAAQKNSPSKQAVIASIRLPDPIPLDNTGAPLYEPICPVADDLPLSDDLIGLYLNAYRPLLRARP